MLFPLRVFWTLLPLDNLTLMSLTPEAHTLAARGSGATVRRKERGEGWCHREEEEGEGEVVQHL